MYSLKLLLDSGRASFPLNYTSSFGARCKSKANQNTNQKAKESLSIEHLSCKDGRPAEQSWHDVIGQFPDVKERNPLQLAKEGQIQRRKTENW